MKGRHAKTRQKVILSGFRMATFRLARQRYDKQKTQRMERRVLSCGGTKGRHAKTRKSHHLAGFRVATFRVFALFVVTLPGGAKCCHAKTRQMVIWSFLRDGWPNAGRHLKLMEVRFHPNDSLVDYVKDSS